MRLPQLPPLLLPLLFALTAAKDSSYTYTPTICPADMEKQFPAINREEVTCIGMEGTYKKKNPETLWVRTENSLTRATLLNGHKQRIWMAQKRIEKLQVYVGIYDSTIAGNSTNIGVDVLIPLTGKQKPWWIRRQWQKMTGHWWAYRYDTKIVPVTPELSVAPQALPMDAYNQARRFYGLPEVHSIGKKERREAQELKNAGYPTQSGYQSGMKSRMAQAIIKCINYGQVETTILGFYHFGPDSLTAEVKELKTLDDISGDNDIAKRARELYIISKLTDDSDLTAYNPYMEPVQSDVHALNAAWKQIIPKIERAAMANWDVRVSRKINGYWKQAMEQTMSYNLEEENPLTNVHFTLLQQLQYLPLLRGNTQTEMETRMLSSEIKAKNVVFTDLLKAYRATQQSGVRLWGAPSIAGLNLDGPNQYEYTTPDLRSIDMGINIIIRDTKRRADKAISRARTNAVLSGIVAGAGVAANAYVDQRTRAQARAQTPPVSSSYTTTSSFSTPSQYSSSFSRASPSPAQTSNRFSTSTTGRDRFSSSSYTPTWAANSTPFRASTAAPSSAFSVPFTSSSTSSSIPRPVESRTPASTASSRPAVSSNVIVPRPSSAPNPAVYIPAPPTRRPRSAPVQAAPDEELPGYSPVDPNPIPAYSLKDEALPPPSYSAAIPA